MITAKYCISQDTEDNLHVSLPYIEPKLPDGKVIAMMNPAVELPILDLIAAIDAHKNKNQKLVNEILSRHFKS